MRIVLFGLISYNNLGDPLISECTEYIVKSIINNQNKQSVTLVADLWPKRNNIFFVRILQVLKRFIFKKKNSIVYDRLSMLEVKLSYNSYYNKIIKEADGIIFVGGALFKWKGEKMQYSVRHVCNLAESFNVPVMFNGIGIEDYDESDIRCIKLKESINNKVVKVITTRDDIDTLNNKFLSNNKIIKTSLVGDSALWLKDLYNVKFVQREYVGINITYLGLFKVYNIENVDLFDIIKNLVQGLKEKNIPFRFYCNGKVADYNGGMEIINKLGIPSSFLLPRAQTTLQLIEQINSFKCIVPMRLHSCIIAYALNVPFATFVWNKKMIRFAGVIQKESYFQDINKLSIPQLVNQIDRIYNNHDIFTNEEKLSFLKQATYQYLNLFISSYVLK